MGDVPAAVAEAGRSNNIAPPGNARRKFQYYPFATAKQEPADPTLPHNNPYALAGVSESGGIAVGEQKKYALISRFPRIVISADGGVGQSLFGNTRIKGVVDG